MRPSLYPATWLIALVGLLVVLAPKSSADVPIIDPVGFDIYSNQICVWSDNKATPMQVRILDQRDGSSVVETEFVNPGSGLSDRSCLPYRFEPGSWLVQVTQDASEEVDADGQRLYPAFSKQRLITRMGQPDIELGALRTKKRVLRARVQADAALTGERAQIRIKREVFRCSSSTAGNIRGGRRYCAWWGKAKTKRKALRLKDSQVLRVARARRGVYQRFVVDIRVPVFQEDSISYRSTRKTIKLYSGKKFKKRAKRRQIGPTRLKSASRREIGRILSS